jgi:two-component sensor histidine kinase
MNTKSADLNNQDNLTMVKQNDNKILGFKNFFSIILIIFSGVFVFLVAGWNSTQANVLLRWSAEREGQTIFTRIMHESGISPRKAYRNSQLLHRAIASDSQIISAGIMLGDKVIASFTNSKSVIVPIKEFPPKLGIEILSGEFTVYRRQTGPGGGHGSGWQRNRMGSGNSHSACLSFYFIFKGPDRKIVAPLIYQKYLWPLVWVLLTIFWGTILFTQTKFARLRQKMQQDSHLAAVGKMSARLAHEIKNPLGAVRGMAQLLARKLSDKDELCDMAITIEKETFRLEELTRNILDFSRSPKLNLIRLNISSLLSDRVSFVKIQNPEHRFQIELPSAPVFCDADENAVTQVVQNLLNNAIDSSEPSEIIEIKLSQNIECALIQIQNSGQLSEEEEKNKFEPFYSTKTKGYGLGLPISKKLVELQGGLLKLENCSANKVLAEFSLKRSDIDE